MSYSLQELAQLTGIPGRTIRFYIAEGLLEGPLTQGSRASYSDQHLSKLRTIRDLQARGLSLRSIRSQLMLAQPGATEADDPVKARLPQSLTWDEYPVGEGVRVQIRSGHFAPHDKRRLLQALSQFINHLEQESVQ
jgi:DNA-binding transcriptional MerR regulator